mmetsp:Transcript_10499/g.30705  ORF Transcript_10499/g.30705 Transcript_10499/m.30705 type:complete len:214 (-) Transcript_10499:1048-1689(-)
MFVREGKSDLCAFCPINEAQKPTIGANDDHIRSDDSHCTHDRWCLIAPNQNSGYISSALLLSFGSCAILSTAFPAEQNISYAYQQVLGIQKQDVTNGSSDSLQNNAFVGCMRWKTSTVSRRIFGLPSGNTVNVVDHSLSRHPKTNSEFIHFKRIPNQACHRLRQMKFNNRRNLKLRIMAISSSVAPSPNIGSSDHVPIVNANSPIASDSQQDA